MAPPMPNPTKRMTANPAKPVARYRPGKPVAEQESSDEDEEESEEEQQKQPQRRPQARPQPPRPKAPTREESEDDDEEGFVTEEEDGEDDGKVAAKASKRQSNSTATGPRPAPLNHEAIKSEAEEEDEASESEEDSEEEDSSSEEEAPQRKFQRPTFIKKSDRKPSTTPASTAAPETMHDSAPDPEIDTQTRRLAQADLLIKDRLERDALARAAGRKAWDADDDVLPESMVDDTDNVDPEAEYAAWKVRELRRLKRDREALIAREKEIEETERRRNLTAEERAKEDQAFLEKQKEEREGSRSDAQFLARYHHKGAFFQGDEAAEVLKRRDVMGARFEDQVTDKSVLPEYMRLRDMTKLGKKGRTRYTDLKGQDTGRFGEDVKRWRGSGGTGGGGGKGGDFDMRGVDERFLPDGPTERGGRTGPTGANASAVAPRRDRDRDRDREREWERERERDRDTRKRSYSYSRSRSRSRSRSPRRRKRELDERDRERARDRGLKAY